MFVRIASIIRPPLSNSVQRLVMSLNDVVAVAEFHAVIRLDAFANSPELQSGNLADHFIAERIVGNGHQPSEQRGRKHLEQRLPQRLRDALRSLASARDLCTAS